MQKRGYKNSNIIPGISILLVSDVLLLFTGCRTRIGETEKNPADKNINQVTISDVNPDYVKFRSYQNIDSTWGYTIFVNSKPYLHFSRIPFFKKGYGFQSKKDADIVAITIVKMIQNGDMTPKLNKRIIDSLELEMKMNESNR